MNNVSAASHTVSANAVAGYTMVIAGDCSGAGAVTVGASQAKVCTVTYNDIAPTLTVTKSVVGSAEAASTFSITVTDGNGDQVIAGNASGTPVTVKAGAYSVLETADSDYVTTYSTDCTGSIALGESKSCTVTNTAKGTITVNKTAIGEDDATFSFTGDLGTFDITTVGGLGSHGVLVAPGTYTVSETSQAGWQQNSTTCNSVVVTAGESVSCEFVNQQQSHIEIRKISVGGTNTFHFLGLEEGGTDVTTVTPEVAASETIDVYTNVLGDAYTVSEAALTGWNYTSSQCVYENESVGTEVTPGSHLLDLDPGDTIICTYTNTASVCGDSNIESGEQCDDGGVVDADGCSSTCQIETGWSCTGEPSTCSEFCGDAQVVGSEECDNGEGNSDTTPDACRLTCEAAGCGDNVEDSGETCDDGNLTSGDGCSMTCVEEVCGDHVTQPGLGETCDDGNTTDGDGCSATCALEVCGDGIVTGGEQCDDENTNSGDGCSATCQNEVLICHIPPGHPSNQADQYVAANQVTGHINHGDHLGSCTSSSSSSSTSSSTSSSSSSTSSTVAYVCHNGTTTMDFTLPDQQAAYDAHIGHDDTAGACGSSSSTSSSSTSSSTTSSSSSSESSVTLSYLCHNEEGNNPSTMSFNLPSQQGSYDAHLGHGDTVGECGSSSSSSSSSSSDGSSDSSSSSSGGSEGSEGSSSSTPIITFGAPDGDQDGDTSNGSYRGSRTNVFRSLISLFGGPNNAGDVPPGGFGGPGNEDFTDGETALICKLRTAIPDDATSAVYTWISEQLAEKMPHSAEAISQELRTGSICPEPVAVKIQTVKPIAFHVDAAGYPVSSNETWNKCIRGTVELVDIRNNPDRDEDGFGYGCGRYHTSTTWRHPDLGVYFTWKKQTKALTLPEGVALKQDATLTQNN